MSCEKNFRKIPTTTGYHATSLENYNLIMHEGFRIHRSEEMMFGKGLYLSYNIDDVQYYKDRLGKKGVVLQISIPKDVDWGYVNQLESIGVLFDYIKNAKQDGWVLEQISERIIANDIKNFPQINYFLNTNLDDSKWKCFKNSFNNIHISKLIHSLSSMESFKCFYVKEDFLSFLSQCKRLKFYEIFINYGNFELDEKSYNKFLKKSYYSLAKTYWEHDVEFAHSQIIIHSREVLKQLFIQLLVS